MELMRSVRDDAMVSGLKKGRVEFIRDRKDALPTKSVGNSVWLCCLLKCHMALEI